MACACQNKPAVAGTKKKRRSGNSRVSGLKMQSPKDLMNLPTLGAAAGTAYGAGKLVEGAEKGEYALLRSKQGAWVLGIGGLAGAFLIPGKGTFSQIARGGALGAAAHGIMVIATDKDFAGNEVTFDTIKEASAVSGVYWPNGYDNTPAAGAGRRSRI